MVIGIEEGAFHLISFLPDHSQRFLPLMLHHRRHTRLYYSGLLEGYLLYCVTQDITVLQLYGCDYGDLRHNQVGGIEPASHTCLKHCPPASLFLEDKKGKQRQKLKGGGLPQFPGKLSALKHLFDELCIADIDIIGEEFPGQCYPLFVGDKMWRCEETCLESQLFQDPCSDGCGGPFSLAPGYVHTFESTLRVTGGLQHICHPLKLVFGLGAGEAAFQVGEAFDIFKGA